MASNKGDSKDIYPPWLRKTFIVSFTWTQFSAKGCRKGNLNAMCKCPHPTLSPPLSSLVTTLLTNK